MNKDFDKQEKELISRLESLSEKQIKTSAKINALVFGKNVIADAEEFKKLSGIDIFE